jgi:hypothetical protein
MSGVTDVEFAPRRRWYEDPRSIIHVVADVKTDGGDVRRNAIRAIAFVALNEQGYPVTRFHANLSPPDGTSVDQRSLARYRDHPGSWQANTTDAQKPAAAMLAFAQWVQGLSGQPVIVGTPLTQISLWLETYLRRYTPHVLYRGPFEGEPLFAGGGIDLPSLIMGATGMGYRQAVEHMLPADWRDNHVETHKCRDDVEMHAALAATILRKLANKR